MTHRDETIHEATFVVSHGQFQLTDLDVVPEVGAELGGMIVPMLPGGAIVRCGIRNGPIRLRAQACENEPPPATAEWDEICEADFDAPVGSVRVTPLFEDPLADIPPLTSGPGTYRLRVHARGRDVAPNRFVESPTEEYFLQVWPAPPASACEDDAVPVMTSL